MVAVGARDYRDDAIASVQEDVIGGTPNEAFTCEPLFKSDVRHPPSASDVYGRDAVEAPSAQRGR
jgi:hypothetical protein